jgi:hypothetical protein
VVAPASVRSPNPSVEVEVVVEEVEEYAQVAKTLVRRGTVGHNRLWEQGKLGQAPPNIALYSERGSIESEVAPRERRQGTEAEKKFCSVVRRCNKSVQDSYSTTSQDFRFRSNRRRRLGGPFILC